MTSTTLSATVESSVSLYFRSGTSDKEYHLYLCKHTDGKYSVHAEYGRRDRPNMKHDKTSAGRVGLFKARELFDDTEREKRSEGYSDMSALRPPASIPGAVVGAAPAGAPAAAVDKRPAALARSFEAYLSAAPEVAEAGKQALGVISSRMGPTKFRGLSTEVRSLLSAVLGDLACSSQDYVDDALASVAKALSARGSRVAELVDDLSGAATAALEAARAVSAPSDTPKQFFAAAFKPVQASKAL